MVRLLAAVAAFVGLTCSALAQQPQPEAASGWRAKPAVTAERFMVAAAHPLATRAGYDVLKAGGTAMDAAVAVQLVLNLVEPQSSGLGGGAFLLYWDAASGTLHSLDGRETAPAAARPSRFLDSDGKKLPFFKAVVGGQSVGVPGTPRLLEVAHQRFGKLPWKSLFQPAITLAEQGFPVSPRMAGSIARAKKRGLTRFAAARAYFFDRDGEPLAAGTMLGNPVFADTLRLLAEGGADAFYQGPIARDIVAAVAATSLVANNITLGDLANYRVKDRPPVCIEYRADRVCGMGPPTSGGLTVGQILKLLEPFDLRRMGWSSEFAHVFAEAGKLAYADRALYMADSDYVAVPTDGLLDPGYLASRSQLIDPAKAGPKAAAGEPPRRKGGLLAPSANPDLPGTSHFVIRDGFGNALSMTTTIESGFGSRVMVRGFLLNNELTDFDRSPTRDGRPVANRVEGGKRPRSSMAPTIVLRDGRPRLLIGSPGGSRIIAYVAKAAIGVLDFGLDPQAAVELGHVVHRNGKTLDIEAGRPVAEWAAPLTAKGHTVKVRDLNSGLHAILIGNDGKLVGGADPRREGLVLGD